MTAPQTTPENTALAQPRLVLEEVNTFLDEKDDEEGEVETKGRCPTCGREVYRGIHGYGTCKCGQALIGRDDL